MRGNHARALALPMLDASLLHSPMSESKPLIDPKELAPAAVGFVLGLALLGCFVLFAKGMGLTLLVNHANIPYQ